MRPNPFFPQLEGPQFLALYIGYIIVVLISFWLIKIYLKKNSQGINSDVFPNLDLYEVAYLRGAEKAVLQTVVYRLHQLGYLTIKQQKAFGFITTSEELVVSEKSQGAGKNNELNDFEIGILKTIQDKAIKSGEIFSSANLLDRVNFYCQNILNKFELLGILSSNELSAQQNIFCAIGIGVMVIPGLLRLCGAFIAGRPNVAFLYFSLSSSALAGFFLLKHDRLSNIGSKILANFKDQYKSGGNDAFYMAVIGLAALAGSESSTLRRLLGYGDAGTGGCCGGGGCGGGGCGGGGCGG